MMSQWKERYLQLWQKLDKRQRYILFGVAGLVIAAIIGAGVWYGSSPNMQPLFTNMETKDAGEVAAKLKEEKVDFKVQETQNGTTILVPVKQVDKLRLNLAAQGLPRGTKGFEIFDNNKLGVTDFQNRIDYLQALQGELTRTIEQIDAVESARVHIVLPQDSLYSKDVKPATASIMLRLKPGMSLTPNEIKGIVNLVAHSVQNLQPENITVINSQGQILNSPQNNNDEKNSLGNITLTQINMTQKVRQQLQAEVQSMLDNALGEGEAFVRVNVALNFDQQQTDKQTFTPVVNNAGIVRSSQELNESYKGTSSTPGGPAGITSNVPGYVAANNSNAQYSKNETTKNYEINEEKQKIISSPGSIKRLNIAVLVSDKINPQQREAISRAVASAVGIDPNRGDTISVEPIPINNSAAEQKAAAEKAAKAKSEEMAILEAIAVVLPLLLLALAYFLYQRKKKKEQEAAEAEAQRQAEIEEERLAAQQAALAEEGGGTDEGNMSEKEKIHLNERQAIEEMIDSQPEQVVEIIKTWLSADD